MKVWITKYALTKGIYEVEGTVCKDISSGMLRVGNDYTTYFHKPHWHESKLDANLCATMMKQKKCASLRKQLAKLEAMTFVD